MGRELLWKDRGCWKYIFGGCGWVNFSIGERGSVGFGGHFLWMGKG